ncbi:MAG: DUF2845 domain-containing protein [Woeseiaceae bacterium]|nr:DUF2845 domain-containing protein [Woeseiaceae bacterium]
MTTRHITAALCLLLLASQSAYAFRCGQKLVKEGMSESEVIALCGEPAETKDLGWRRLPYIDRHRGGGLLGRPSLDGYFVEDVRVTQLIYNFGPRKLMQRLRFENSVLVEIEAIGYGYRQRSDESSD